MSKYGVITEPGTIQFERLLPGPVEQVWEYITESEKRANWLASGEMELHEGGRYHFIFYHVNLSSEEEAVPERYKQYRAGDTMQGRVLECKPPRLLRITWGADESSEVLFELTPKEENVQLVLTHSRLDDDRDTMLRVASDWHTYLNILLDHLNGRKPGGFWTTYTRMEEKYGQRLR